MAEGAVSTHVGEQWARRGLYAGVLGPSLFTVVYVVEDVLRPSVNPWRQSISFLSHGPAGWVQNADFLVVGGLVLLFAVALTVVAAQGAADERTWLNRLARLEGVGAVGLVLVGLVRQGRLGAVPPPGLSTPFGYLTVAGMIHIVGGIMIFGAGACAGAMGAQAVPSSLMSRGWRRFSLASAVLVTAALVLFVLTAANGGPSGLFERVAAFSSSVWTVVLAVRLDRWAASRHADRGTGAVAPNG